MDCIHIYKDTKNYIKLYKLWKLLLLGFVIRGQIVITAERKTDGWSQGYWQKRHHIVFQVKICFTFTKNIGLDFSLGH